MEHLKTLVIHPDDPTTSFLSKIYEDKKDWTVVTDNLIPRSTLKTLIKEHNRIIMLGHGTPRGLLGRGRTIIDSTFVYLLRNKPNNVYIWCHADQFVRYYNLKGFVTGMIISETPEAFIYSIKPEEGQIEASNELFAHVIGESINLSPNEMRDKVIKEYIDETNIITEFNNANIFSFV